MPVVLWAQPIPAQITEKCCPQNLVKDALCVLRYLVPFGSQAQITKNDFDVKLTKMHVDTEADVLLANQLVLP